MSSRINLPFLIVSVVLALATLCTAALQLSSRVPLSPWEPSITMEAMRLTFGLPVYEPAHATHLYGPLLTVLFAGLFKIVGLNLIAARIVMSIFAFALAIFLSAIFRNAKNRAWSVLAVLVFLGINFRTNLIVFSTQPDWAAVFCATVALYFWITRNGSLFRSVACIALFVCAMLFKQTSVAFALIPLGYALLWKRPLNLRNLASSLLPAMSILLALTAIRFLWPQMFTAMVTIPGSIKVYPGRAFNVTLYLFVTFPIFLVALWSTVRSREATTETERWILSALIVLVPISIWTMCKSGSGYNSLLFAYLAMTALFVARLDAILDWTRSLSMSRAFLAASIVALAILVSCFVQFDHDVALLNVRHGDEKYDTAVALAHDLKGVVTPQDPTIAYRANGYFGRSLYFELDMHAVNGNWPSELPESVQQELAASNYVLEVKSYVPTPVLERALAKKFHAVAIPGLSGSAYTLWAKTD